MPAFEAVFTHDRRLKSPFCNRVPGFHQGCSFPVDKYILSDRCNGRKSSNDAGSRVVLLATMNAQQAVAKRSVGRRVTHLDAPFFWLPSIAASGAAPTRRNAMPA
ncbi:MAG: hypothetical protein KGI36_04105 [Burkholderiales bacterium]|nr:hypothetical protein [Burkholderiales bacterium]